MVGVEVYKGMFDTDHYQIACKKGRAYLLTIICEYSRYECKPGQHTEYTVATPG